MTLDRTVVADQPAAKRAVAYALFARLFAYPDAKAVRALRRAARVAAGPCADTPAGPLAAAASRQRADALRREYIRTFTLTTNPDCPTFETAYLCRDTFQQTHRLASLCGFYEAWGVRARRTGGRPDDIGAELEFVGLLCAKEWLALQDGDPERTALAVEAQRLFFREHLGQWGLGFARRLVATAEPGSIYALAGASLQTWLAEEALRLEVELSPAAEVTVAALASEPRGDVTPPFVALETIGGIER